MPWICVVCVTQFSHPDTIVIPVKKSRLCFRFFTPTATFSFSFQRDEKKEEEKRSSPIVPHMPFECHSEILTESSQTARTLSASSRGTLLRRHASCERVEWEGQWDLWSNSVSPTLSSLPRCLVSIAQDPLLFLLHIFSIAWMGHEDIQQMEKRDYEGDVDTRLSFTQSQGERDKRTVWSTSRIMRENWFFALMDREHFRKGLTVILVFLNSFRRKAIGGLKGMNWAFIDCSATVSKDFRIK